MSNGDECNGASSKFIVLADYMALTSREIDLSEDEVVDVIKISQSTMIIVKPSLQLACPYLISWKRKFPEVVEELRTTRRRLKITKKILVIINKILLPSFRFHKSKSF